MRTLAIGDIHGCSASLKAVLEVAEVTPSDFLIFLGDYIDRGPDSKGVVARIIELSEQQNVVALRGNHEVMILSARDDALQSNLWRSYGGDEALRSYGAGYSDQWQCFVPPEHWSFFERTKPWFETETHIFVHATLAPELDLPDQPDYVVYWESCVIQLRHKTGKTVVCGHTPQRSGFPTMGEYCVCIDTGVNSGGWLTCLDVDSGRFWQANERGARRLGNL
jgi:serine/threonine protein phosphatase 1